MAGIVLLRTPPPAEPVSKAPEPAKPDVSSPSARPETSEPAAPKSDTPNSAAELSALIREFAARGGNAADLYKKLVSMRLAEKAWWRSAADFSALLDLTTDAALDELFRTLAMRVYLAGVPDAELKKNADSIQTAAIAAQDDMVSAVLQGMADRSVAPEHLIKGTLTAQGRGTRPKCYAWYAARLTQPRNLEYAALALADSEAGLTEASKVGFDYLAGASFAADFASTPSLQHKVTTLVTDMTNLPQNAGPIQVANGDAFVRAIPSVMETESAKAALLSMIDEAANAEVRLSALEQLVNLHTSGRVDVAVELHEVRNRIGKIFTDPAKQIRAKARLNRASRHQ